MEQEIADAVVIGAGPNGLVAANPLADAGWDVLVLEANDEVGGAVRTAEVTAPGFCNDLFSAFYPLAAASPVIRGLSWSEHGLRWRHAPAVLAHPLDDGRCAVLPPRPDVTAAPGRVPPGRRRRVAASCSRSGSGSATRCSTRCSPRSRRCAPGAGSLARSEVAGTLGPARLAVLPVRRLGRSGSAATGRPLLLTGNALHADVPPDAAGSGVFGWLLAMLGQDVGFPVPEGGAGQLAEALAGAGAGRRGRNAHRDARSSRVVVGTAGRSGCARPDGTRSRARRAVLADVAAPALPRTWSASSTCRAGCARDLDRFQWDHADVQGELGARRPGAVDAPRARAAPAPCTSASTSTAWPLRPRTCRWGRRRTSSCCSAR